MSLQAAPAPVLPFPGLVNGDFEDSSGTFPAGWNIDRSAIAQHSGLGGTATAIWLSKQADGGGRVTQSLPVEPGSEWELDLRFAMEDPGDASARGLNLILNNKPNNGNLNLRVNGDGSIQTVTSVPTTTWIDVPGLTSAVEFSIDANGNGSFADAEDTLNVYRLVIRGDYSTSVPEYTVLLSEANATDLTRSGTAANWFTNPPGEGSSIGSVSISAQSSGGSFVVDQVVLRSLTPTPGDYNSDGAVDGSDFLAWQQQFGSAVDPATGADGNGDGVVDAADLAIWSGQFSGGIASTLAAHAVPEPASAVFAALLGVIVSLSRMGRH